MVHQHSILTIMETIIRKIAWRPAKGRSHIDHAGVHMSQLLEEIELIACAL